MTRILLTLAGALVLAAACTMTPAYERTEMTLAEANIEGMECRTANPIGSNMPRSVCASPELWAAYDRDQEFNTDLTLDTIRNMPTSPFRPQ